MTISGLAAAQRNYDRQMPVERSSTGEERKRLIADEVAHMLTTDYDPMKPEHFVEAIMESPIKDVAPAIAFLDKCQYQQAGEAFRMIALNYWSKYCTPIAESRIKEY